MLEPYRVIEVAGFGTSICGQILADLGADVIVVEPPGGDSLRRRAPFYNDEPHPDRSLPWWAYNRNKRGVTLDLEQAEALALFRQLVEGADFLIEGLPPGKMNELGLGYEALSAENQRLIMVSTSPFGQDGPKAGYSDVDLVITAASSVLAATGDADRPPLHISVPQAPLHAGAEAAATAMIAHYGRERTGRGQYLDVSAQQALTMATQCYVLAAGWQDERSYLTRVAGGIKAGPIVVKLIFPCKDGYVSCTFLFGSAIGPFSRRLMQAVQEAGFADESLANKDFINYTTMLLTGAEPISELYRAYAAMEAFFLTQTKADLFELAQQRGLLIAPCSTVEDSVHSPQLQARDYWVSVEHPDLGRSFLYPGPFVKLSERPIEYRRPAPLLGEHNAEVFGSLGVSASELALLRAQATI